MLIVQLKFKCLKFVQVYSTLFKNLTDIIV